MAGMGGALGAGRARGGLLGLLTRIGPELLAASAVLVLVSLGMRRRAAVLPAAVGGAVLYWGMYLQPSANLMYATLAAGFTIWLASWVWVRASAPDHSCGSWAVPTS